MARGAIFTARGFMTITDCVEASELGKQYGSKAAVENLTLKVPCGSILGLIGPNGAGKTTTILLLAGLLRPSSGTVRVFGQPVRVGQGEKRIGIVCPKLEDLDYVTGRESIVLAARLHGLGKDVALNRTEALLSAFDLDTSADMLINSYSSGMRQKLRIARALIYTPDLLLLDEPYEALDPSAAYRLTSILKRFAGQGGTVVLSSHDLGMVERIADHYAILNSGKLVEHAAMGTIHGSEQPEASELERRMWDLVGTPPALDLAWLYNNISARG